MKIHIYITVLLFMGVVFQAMTQLKADAGQDIVVCVNLDGNVESRAIGGTPAATGGIEPYSYYWEAEYIRTIGNYFDRISAADFLSDTTAANPLVILAEGDTIHFRLTVTDATGAIAIDSSTVYFSRFFTHAGYQELTINQGDSVYLSGMTNVAGGIAPYEYLWRPNHGLSDSTSLSFWAKPFESIAYYLTLTDSAGCTATGAPSYYVFVQHASVNEQSENPAIKIFPNPAVDLVNVEINNPISGRLTLGISDNSGRLLYEKETDDHYVEFPLSGYPSGIYILHIRSESGLLFKKKFIRK
jgi:hypothetical protein